MIPKTHVPAVPVAYCLMAVLAQAQSPVPKVMPLGDSITRGTNDINYPNGSIPGGYRKELGTRLGSSGFLYDFVGEKNDNAAPGMDPDHNGNDGFRTDEILANLPAWLAVDPDVVLLKAGTNDILQDKPVATVVANLSSLIDAITTNAPHRRLYVSTVQSRRAGTERPPPISTATRTPTTPGSATSSRPTRTRGAMSRWWT